MAGKDLKTQRAQRTAAEDAENGARDGDNSAGAERHSAKSLKKVKLAPACGKQWLFPVDMAKI
jgi:hypothetical protein